MATPFFQLQNNPVSVLPNTPGSVLFLTKDAAGGAISVASGYTATGLQSVSTSDQNVVAAAVDVTTLCTLAFGATGVTMSWTAAQADGLAAAFQTLHQTMALTISNDAGSTQSLLALFAVTISPFFASFQSP